MSRPSPLAVTRRLVLDTNVVLDLVVFRDAGVVPLVHALDSGGAIAVTSRACLEELRRVLGYARLKLDHVAQSRALREYLARVALLDVPDHGVGADLPLCTDPDDQKFLELAWHAGAHALITKDRALLRLARGLAHSGRFDVLPPERFQAPAPRRDYAAAGSGSVFAEARRVEDRYPAVFHA